MYMFTYIHTCLILSLYTHKHIYVYRKRERERESHRQYFKHRITWQHACVILCVLLQVVGVIFTYNAPCKIQYCMQQEEGGPSAFSRNTICCSVRCSILQTCCGVRYRGHMSDIHIHSYMKIKTVWKRRRVC